MTGSSCAPATQCSPMRSARSIVSSTSTSAPATATGSPVRSARPPTSRGSSSAATSPDSTLAASAASVHAGIERAAMRCLSGHGEQSRCRGAGCDRGADLSHLGPEPELRSVIEDPRRDDDLLRAPDPDAFGAFYARHARAVEAFFARRTGNRDLACDLTGETFAARPDRAPALPRPGGRRRGRGSTRSRRGGSPTTGAARRPRIGCRPRLMAHRRIEVAEERRPRPGGGRPSAGAARAPAA